MKYFQKCPHCLGRAWQYKERPRTGEVILASDVVHKITPKPGDIMICQECEKEISAMYFCARWLLIQEQ